MALQILPYASPGTIKGQLLGFMSGKEVPPWGAPLVEEVSECDVV